MYVAGYVDDSFMQTLRTHLRFNSHRTNREHIPELTKNEPQQIFVEKSNAVQNAIRIGKLIIGRDHPDFIPLSVAVTVLGGYFGARLMKTLREEKGYTYGIYSFIYSHRKLNTMIITTEVASEFTADALKCIYNEIDDMCQHKISDDELDNVKSYLMGQLVRSIDGPLSTMDTFKNLRTNGADFHYLERFVNELQNTTPDIILTMAQRYLSDGYTEVVVGKKN
jgi:predicted Zn-dependent peptidase